ncbi:MAG: hypothetical protein F6K10_03175 [Moorea sp. SIO2B7]|nr:hypothetical protein [Moorena sp. SIO2B7]
MSKKKKQKEFEEKVLTRLKLFLFLFICLILLGYPKLLSLLLAVTGTVAGICLLTWWQSTDKKIERYPLKLKILKIVLLRTEWELRKQKKRKIREKNGLRGSWSLVDLLFGKRNH